MSNNVKLGDDSVRVPRLELSGANWVLYKDRLLWAADAKGCRGHLDGTAQEPIAPQAIAAQSTSAAGTTAPGAAVGSATAGGAAGAAAGGTGGGTGTAGPVGGTVGAGGASVAAASVAGVTPDLAQVTYEAALAGWRKGEADVKQLIASTIPDSLFMKIRSQPTARAI